MKKNKNELQGPSGALGGMRTVLYYLGVSLLFTHEMDAVAHTEWRLLLVLRDMTDQAAYAIFLALHVPLFLLFFWLGHNPSDSVRRIFRGMVAVFLMVHALIHFQLTGAPGYTFAGVLSNTLIYTAALCGLVYLVLPVLRSSPDAS